MNPSNRSSTEPQEDPGAFPIPFGFTGVRLGSRLDSIPPSVRYWAVGPARTDALWYHDMLQANNRYEEWLLTTQPPEDYPVPIGKKHDGKKIGEIDDGLRYWGVHPDRSSRPWYIFFVRASDRLEQHRAATQEPGEFPLRSGISDKYTGMPIKDIPQDDVWWFLRFSNRQKGWYQPLYNANKRMLDDVYQSRSPGSEPIWFGKRYRGLRLDQVCEREGYMRWCYDPRRKEMGWLYRFKDLVERLHEWRRAHPERSGPRQRRKAPDIQNPVGEAVGPWDDGPVFIQSDGEDPEYATDSDEPMGNSEQEDEGDEGSNHSDASTSSSVPMSPSKRKRTTVIQSDEESEDGGASFRKLGKTIQSSI
ncbi:hypothetical protein L210DRAFT_3561201 [Boletus edulis BED1]|uniref:Uncharacterized protein n=1 Tax=Boletus edulis BED1 TaxID=1328754 RepID=A0AAD4BIL1_BOLED|nr:hypothetical protein L210DRAFT_3561201 [Boletus edulis BED1]